MEDNGASGNADVAAIVVIRADVLVDRGDVTGVMNGVVPVISDERARGKCGCLVPGKEG
jgi:hypothetical protein